eukprot:5520760-Pleurochrysis_carterae.AAC.3
MAPTGQGFVHARAAVPPERSHALERAVAHAQQQREREHGDGDVVSRVGLGRLEGQARIHTNRGAHIERRQRRRS